MPRNGDAEKWRGTIARQVAVHHSTIRRVLAQAGLRAIASTRAAQINAYLPFMLQTLEQYPTLTASRLHGMVRERGYRGGGDYFGRLIARRGGCRYDKQSNRHRIARY